MMHRIKTSLRSILYRFAPELGHYVTATRFRRICRKRFYEFQVRIALKLYGPDPIIVLAGPFKGMHYFNQVIGGSITPKWLGSYENELHHIIFGIDWSVYSCLINIGSAEGYYAVGFARQNPSKPVYTFDVDPFARRSLERLASLNNVDNIIVGKYCSSVKLNQLVQNTSFVLCDIEGFEVDLLDPKLVPGLASADVLVEIHPHDSLSMQSTRELLQLRFEPTHKIEIIETAARDLGTWQQICHNRLSPDELIAAIEEHRTYPRQYWLFMRAHRQQS